MKLLPLASARDATRPPAGAQIAARKAVPLRPTAISLPRIVSEDFANKLIFPEVGLIIH